MKTEFYAVLAAVVVGLLYAAEDRLRKRLGHIRFRLAFSSYGDNSDDMMSRNARGFRRPPFAIQTTSRHLMTLSSAESSTSSCAVTRRRRDAFEAQNLDGAPVLIKFI